MVTSRSKGRAQGSRGMTGSTAPHAANRRRTAASGHTKTNRGNANRAKSAQPRGRHHILGTFAAMLAVMALICTVMRELPADLQALPYVPVIVSATPWFMLVALIALVMAIMSRRALAALIAIAALALNIAWQYPFFATPTPLVQAAKNAVAGSAANTTDAYARVMTFNVYKGRADAQSIVDLVRDNRVEVLALQETTDDFVQRLNDAGITRYLPYANVSSSDGMYGNGLWSATPLGNPSDTDVDSSASFMPGGTVDLGGNQIRFISVHTTAPVPGYWDLWKRSLDEIARLKTDTDTRFILMGDFNATYDHTPLRTMLGDRFSDAVRISGHGLAFSWPTNRPYLPRFAGIDHVILDQGMTAGQCSTVKVSGSDHAALLATIAVQ